ncbi:disease resistance protein Roq1 isoform X1 [Lactuca sativa]|uniref:TIR domain-containing protein n=1 Tax=Lactuca sativa TaxID=4236 RepID=A0A9R1UP82_LACSA|nr:disease resistance protein Roq1 isoform X1 [Lactuca sativa]KAJ0191332.1 hypothetical protein LSAT_V11C800408180 [Lactuca sativa]
MASSSSSSSSQPWEYHVFLSFRGEDTRQNLVGHLYKALVEKGIYTYKDDETLPRGESISPALMKAIEGSQLAVVVFSKNYADSSWCLEELSHIMECKETRGQIVMPIFYDVDPSYVRNQKEKYGEAFAKHELKNTDKIKSLVQAIIIDPCGWFFAPFERKREYDEEYTKQHSENKTKVESWRKAIVDTSNISGWFIANRDQSKAVEEIVETISQKLHPTLVEDDNLIGMKVRMQDLMSKLQIGFGGKRMIGIWGVGGGGKTTLASSIYDDISRKFDGCCYLKNVREESSKTNGLENLQEKILCGILKQNQVGVGRVEEGRRMIRDRLQHKKVLIVLDDVNELEQLEELAGSHDWFGEGSRILITTRDEHILTGHKVDVIHNISLLNDDEAMKLFCKHAPQGYRRIKDYEQLSKDVVSYACGLPLALRVLGRFLCDKETNEWRSALARLKEIPETDILEKLKLSFDVLTHLERELFLDIACFFRGVYKDERIMMKLDARGFHPVIGIKVLIQKALITISDGRFDMHDLVQEMGHYIVRGKHPKNPEKHSRVWKVEDVLKICAMDATTNLDKIEAINLLYLRSDESHVYHIVANMKKLRSISLEYYEALFETPLLIIMPGNFPPRELCCLTLRFLNAKQLWEGYKYLPNLRMINLEHLRNLIKTPDFNGLPNLERLMVYDSPLLEEIHPSFGQSENLVCVEIRSCDNLQMLPPITQMKHLETLVLSGCSTVNNLSKIQQNMEKFVPQNMNYIGLWFSSECLRKLDLRWFKLADGVIGSPAVWELPNLQELNLTGNSFVRLNFSLLRVPQLQYLNISQCYNLVELSDLPSSIAVVIADGCRSLETLGDISNCKCLWKVSLSEENNLGPHFGDMLLDSMLQGNAKHYFINITISDIDIWMGLPVVWVDWVKTYNMFLPHDWYNHFSGILMFVKSEAIYMEINISMKHGLEEDFQSQLSKESNERPDAHSRETCVGYVSFRSLRHSGCLDSTYNTISFSLCNEYLYGYGCRFRAILVPKDDPMQTADSSEFWDAEEVYERRVFTIQHDANSSIEILWRPVCHL